MAWQAVAAHWKVNRNHLEGGEHTGGFMELFHLSPPNGPQLNSAASVVPRSDSISSCDSPGALCTPFHTQAVPQVARPHPPPKNEKQECEVHRKHSSLHRLGSAGVVSGAPLLWCTTRFSHTLSHHSSHSCAHSYFPLSWASGCLEFNLQIESKGKHKENSTTLRVFWY